MNGGSANNAGFSMDMFTNSNSNALSGHMATSDPSEFAID